MPPDGRRHVPRLIDGGQVGRPGSPNVTRLALVHLIAGEKGFGKSTLLRDVRSSDTHIALRCGTQHLQETATVDCRLATHTLAAVVPAGRRELGKESSGDGLKAYDPRVRCRATAAPARTRTLRRLFEPRIARLDAAPVNDELAHVATSSPAFPHLHRRRRRTFIARKHAR